METMKEKNRKPSIMAMFWLSLASRMADKLLGRQVLVLFALVLFKALVMRSRRNF